MFVTGARHYCCSSLKWCTPRLVDGEQQRRWEHQEIYLSFVRHSAAGTTGLVTDNLP